MDDDERLNDSEQRPRFKVTDRRKFAADGTPRSSEPAGAEPTEDRPAADGPAGDGPAGDSPAGDSPADDSPADDPNPDPTDDPTDAAGAARLEVGGPAPAAGNPENLAGTDPTPAVEPRQQEPPSAAPQSSIADLPRDFSAFVEGMYLEAMLYLGALPDPRSGDVMEDVELARYKIDLLAMIQEKTQGNLSDDEKQQLEEVLYQLRTVYVQKTQTADS